MFDYTGKRKRETMKKLLLLLLVHSSVLYCMINQTEDVTPVITNGALPFKISITVDDFQIPGGIHSAAVGQWGSQYLFITGRTNGLHGFANSGDFPPSEQNRNVFVVDTHNKRVQFRSLDDPLSGLSQAKIDTLSVVSPQSHQINNTLYITGGYGIDTATNTFSTKDTLTAINISGLIHWVANPSCTCRASDYIRQISNPIFQVTGGVMYQFDQCPTLLIFGQNFIGNYTTASNGIYTRQVRAFDIVDDGCKLGVRIHESTSPDPNYRRRDLNIIPIIKTNKCKDTPAYVALSGVFTLNTGIWTVPVEITTDGTPTMADPLSENTFKQAMNNYTSAHVELLSKNGDMYTVLFGGITYGFFENGQFMTSTDFPFTNEITVVKRSASGNYQQFFLPVEYPVILSTQSNPGNRLRFGAGARFVLAPDLPIFFNDVLNLKKIKKPTVIGYIIGGIQSTVANTNVISDSAASPYIFKVTLTPCC